MPYSSFTIRHSRRFMNAQVKRQFLKLTGHVLTIDVTEYPLDPIDRILGILKWMVSKVD